MQLNYNLKPTVNHLRHEECDIPQGTRGCFNVDVLLQTKSNLILTIAGSPLRS